MTVRINFLPRNYQPAQQWSAKGWVLAAAAVVAAVGAGAYYASVHMETATMAQKGAADQAKLSTVKVQLAEAADIKAREQRVAVAEQDLKALAGRPWSTVLTTLSRLTPEHVTWMSMKTIGNDIVLKGNGRRMVDMAQLMGGLVMESTVQQVTLKYINEQGIPVTVTMNPGETAETKSGLPGAAATPLGVVRQLDFEMTITLVPAEGRQLPNGA